MLLQGKKRRANCEEECVDGKDSHGNQPFGKEKPKKVSKHVFAKDVVDVAEEKPTFKMSEE